MIENILFPVDFSPPCAAIAAYVQRAALICGARVTLIHVFDLTGHNGSNSMCARFPRSRMSTGSLSVKNSTHSSHLSFGNRFRRTALITLKIEIVAPIPGPALKLRPRSIVDSCAVFAGHAANREKAFPSRLHPAPPAPFLSTLDAAKLQPCPPRRSGARHAAAHQILGTSVNMETQLRIRLTLDAGAPQSGLHP